VFGKELVQRRVGYRALCGAAELQHMFGGIFRVQAELMNCKLLDGADTGAGRELMFRGPVGEMNLHLDAAAAADMDALTVTDMAYACMLIALQVML
jgi:hypothetical protein